MLPPPAPVKPTLCASNPRPCADPSGNVALLVELQQLVAEAGGAAWSYPWLPTPAVGALGNLLHASVLRSLGKATPAAACLAAASEVVEQQLAALDIDLQVGAWVRVLCAYVRGRACICVCVCVFVNVCTYRCSCPPTLWQVRLH